MGGQYGGTNLGLTASSVQEKCSWAVLVGSVHPIRKLRTIVTHRATCFSQRGLARDLTRQALPVPEEIQQTLQDNRTRTQDK